MECEVYVRGCHVGVALQWLALTLGHLEPADEGYVLFFHARWSGQVVLVALTPQPEGAPFLAICCKAPSLPWASSIEMARAVYAGVGLESRCCADPEMDDPYLWWQVKHDCDGPIEWDPGQPEA